MLIGYLFFMFSLGVVDVWYYFINWSYGGNGSLNCGYMWWECLYYIGFYLDKIMVIEVLIDLETNFVVWVSFVDIC